MIKELSTDLKIPLDYPNWRTEEVIPDLSKIPLRMPANY